MDACSGLPPQEVGAQVLVRPVPLDEIFDPRDLGDHTAGSGW